MDIIAIPEKLFEDPAYKDLTNGNKLFIIDLYALFGDCQSFLITLSDPGSYRQSCQTILTRRVTALMTAGLLQIVGSTLTARSSYSRVFGFKYSVSDIEFPRLSSDSAGQPIQASNNLTH